MVPISDSGRSAALREPGLMADIAGWTESLGCSSDDLSQVPKHKHSELPLGSDAFLQCVGSIAGRAVRPRNHAEVRETSTMSPELPGVKGPAVRGRRIRPCRRCIGLLTACFRR